MKQLSILFILIAALSLAGCQMQTQAAQDPTPIPVVTGDSNIVVDGKLVPIEHVELSFNMPGVISEVLVEEGQLVEPGQALARLDQKPRLAAAVSAAELELVNAQQVIKTLNETSSVDTASAQQKVADARDAVRYAERYLNNLNSGSRGTDITKAEANVGLLKDRLKKARERLGAERDLAEARFAESGVERFVVGTLARELDGTRRARVPREQRIDPVEYGTLVF